MVASEKTCGSLCVDFAFLFNGVYQKSIDMSSVDSTWEGYSSRSCFCLNSMKGATSFLP